MKKYILLLLTLSGIAIANLPPTTSKISGDSAPVTTFNYEFPNFTGTHNGATVTLDVLGVAGGGTGSSSQNFVDLTTGQTIGGVKTFSDGIIGNITGNASTVTTNANLTGDVTSIGNTTSYNNVVPVAKGGTGSATQNFVDLTTNQTVAGEKTFSNKARLSQLQATSSAGVDLLNSSSTNVAIFGAGGSTGTSLLGTTNIGSASNDYTQVSGGTGSTSLTATGSSTNIDINLTAKGSGSVVAPKLSTNDTTFSVKDSSDPTKQITLDAAGTAGTLTTLASSQTANRLITLPDLTTTLVGTTGTQTISDKTFVDPILGNATGTSLALTGGFSSSFINSLNLLPNGDIEVNDVTMFTVGSGNAKARTTTSGEFSSNTAALKITTTAATLDVSQSVNTPSGIQKQGFLRIIYRIPAAVTDTQICTVVDTAEQTCVPSSRLLNNGLFNSIEVPLVFGSTSVGWKAKTTATNSQDFFIDGIVVGQGLGLQNLQGDTLYSATVSNAGAITQESKSGWLTSCSWSPTGTLTCNFATGTFTVTPNCWASSTNAETGLLGAPSTSSVQFFGQTSAGSAGNATRTVVTCQKQGSDYLAASSNVYSQANADFGGTQYTPTITNGGTTSLNTAYYARQGEYAYISGMATFTGAGASGTLTFSMPSGLTINTSKLPTIGGGLVVGAGAWFDSGSAEKPGNTLALSSTTFSIITDAGSTNSLQGSSLASGDIVRWSAWVPVLNWSSANAIVGSFENVPTTPGLSKSSLVSAVVSGTEVITENESAFITSCTDGTPSVCTLTSSFFTATPKCWANPNVSGTVATVSSRSTSSISVERTANTTAFTLFCQGAR